MKTHLKNERVFLDSQIQQKSNNLEFMKLLAAWLVIVHHAFDLNLSDGEWIKLATGNQLDFGTMAVSLFFLASGLFISKSMEKSKKAIPFFKARFIRVWPPLAVVVGFSVVMGAFVTIMSFKEYITNLATWKYLLNALFVLQHSLPGVFDSNVFGNTVNGALWTLPVEVACYIACYVIYKLHLMEKKRILFVMALYIILVIAGYSVCNRMGLELVTAAFRPIYFFLLGMVLYVYRQYIPVSFKWFFCSLMGLVVCLIVRMPVIAVWVFYPYLIIYTAFMIKQCSNKMSYCGRFSYTIYLCAFPIQQLLIYKSGGQMNVYLNLVLSIVIATMVGGILHFTIEKRVK